MRSPDSKRVPKARPRRFAFFPYSPEYEHFLRFECEALGGAAVIPFGSSCSGLVGRELHVGGIRTRPVVVRGDLDSSLAAFDGLVLAPAGGNEELKRQTCRVLERAASMKKKVALLGSEPEPFCPEVVRELKAKKQLVFQVAVGRDARTEGTRTQSNMEVFAALRRPLVALASAGGNSGKFEVQLAVAATLASKSHRVVQFGTKPYSAAFGLQPFPTGALGMKLSHGARIGYLNSYLSKEEERRNPEVTVLGIPGGFCYLCREVNGEYGVWHMEVNIAARPDTTILCVYYDPGLGGKEVERVVDYYESTLRSRVAAVVVSDRCVNWSRVDEDRVLDTVEVNRARVSRLCSMIHVRVPCISIGDPLLGQKLYARLRTVLTPMEVSPDRQVEA